MYHHQTAIIIIKLPINNFFSSLLVEIFPATCHQTSSFEYKIITLSAREKISIISR